MPAVAKRKRRTAEYDHRVSIPEGELDGLKVERFDIDESSIEHLQAMMSGRGCRPGTYTKLVDRGQLWMSDTTAEWRDHLGAVWKIREPDCRRVLINGLGIGMVLKAALACDHVEHVDVVEIDPRVVKLVGPAYADRRLTIHTADAYTMKWPAGTRWDVAWHDIWPDLCEDNLEEMAKLHRSYGRRVGWQGSWGKTLLEVRKRQTRDAFWRY